MPEPKKPSARELREKLTPEQYRITQEQGTEPPFANAFWDQKEPGLYVDIVSGEPLFSSLDKFDSGCGWPSFTRPLEERNVYRREDLSHGMERIEVRSRHADSHLGHVFDDGPAPTGLRYCINSAALRFVPAHRLVAEGYGDWARLFEPESGAGRDSGASAGAASAREERDPKGTTTVAAAREVATFAGGCFWGVEDIIRKLPGVIDTEVGYTGGGLDNPTYEDVHTGETGHAESVQVTFDPSRLSYDELLRTFFRLHDPTTKNRQGNDRGTQYRSAIFVHSPAQRRIAERVRDEVNRSGKWPREVVTEIVEAGRFYPAEDYHQDYLVRHPNGYTCHYLRD